MGVGASQTSPLSSRPSHAVSALTRVFDALWRGAEPRPISTGPAIWVPALRSLRSLGRDTPGMGSASQSSLVKQPGRHAELVPGLVFGRRGRPVFRSFACPPKCERWRAEERVPWISPERPGCYRANHSHWSERIVRDATRAPTARHAASLSFVSNTHRPSRGLTPAGNSGDRPGHG